MRKFEFKLDAVLRHRRSREEEALKILGKAQRNHQMELRRKEDLLEHLNASLKRREALGSVAIDIQLFHLEQSFISGTKQRIAQADHAISRSWRGVEKALRAFLHARRQTRMMESLHDKALAEYKKQRVKKELRELDDLMIMRKRFKGALQ